MSLTPIPTPACDLPWRPPAAPPILDPPFASALPAGLARHCRPCAERAPGPAGGFGGTSAALAPSRERPASRPGAAPTMRGCPQIALLCALPWLLRAAAPGRPAQHLARRRDPRDPARGADFDRVYSGEVSLSTENIYSFNYTSHPGQVSYSLTLARLPETCQISEPRSLLWVPWEWPSGDLRDQGTLLPFLLLQSSNCPA